MGNRANMSRREEAVSSVVLPAQVVMRCSVFEDQEVVCPNSMELMDSMDLLTAELRVLIPAKTDFHRRITLVYFGY